MALFEAVFLDDVAESKRLIASGVDVDEKHKTGYTALHFACLRNKEDCVRVLLQHGADPNIVDRRGSTPLLHACCAYPTNLNIIRMLLDYGADRNKLPEDLILPDEILELFEPDIKEPE
jgi:ankyrin repeat protein